MLSEGNRNEFAESAAFSAQAAAGYLSRGISQGTSNTITSLLGLKPRPIVSCNQGESLQPTGASPRSRMHSAFHLTDITAQLAVPQPSTSTDVGMRHDSFAVHVPITNAMEWDPSWNTLLIDTWNSLPLVGDLPELPPFWCRVHSTDHFYAQPPWFSPPKKSITPSYNKFAFWQMGRWWSDVRQFYCCQQYNCPGFE